MKIPEWRAYFIDRGVENSLIERYISYISVIQKNKVPVIFELEHLSLLVGVKVEFLVKMIASPESFYRKFEIPKRAGGRRQIMAPYGSLLLVQRWVLHNVLSAVDISVSAHGFCRGRSILTNATPHLAAKALLKMDIKNFFRQFLSHG